MCFCIAVAFTSGSYRSDSSYQGFRVGSIDPSQKARKQLNCKLLRCLTCVLIGFHKNIKVLNTTKRSAV